MRFLLFIFLLSCASLCSGQSSDQEIVKIETIDNQILLGQLVNISADSITIDNESLGVITLAKANIAVFYNNDFGNGPKNNSEPYYVTTAIPNGRNNHHYRNYALFGQNFVFGAYDNLDVSFGFELLSVFVEDDSTLPVMQVGAKYGGQVAKNLHLGLSTKVLFNSEGGVILTSFPITIGELRTNFTIAPTLVLELGEDYREFSVLFNFNIALSNKLRIVTDGIYTEGNIIATSLLEIRLKGNILLQPGILYSDDFQIVPNFSFTIPFGSSKS